MDSLNKQIKILDSTLREGAQHGGISFSVEDKIQIIMLLDEMQVDYIELGTAFSPKDIELFNRVKDLKLKHSKLVTFGPTHRKECDAEDDKGFTRLVAEGISAVTVFGKTSVLHVDEVIGCSLEENLKMIYSSCKYCSDNGKEVIFDAEHFFDGYRDNKDYAIKCLKSAVDGGARVLCLCDTNGGSFPMDVAEITQKIVEIFPDVEVGVHCHNDGGMAVASTLLSVKSGATHVQGTFLGQGERCGNAPLSTVIPYLVLKMGYNCSAENSLEKITAISKEIAEVCNIHLPANSPFVGRAAFSHKAGTHVDAVLKDNKTFEFIKPESVGNHRKFITSEMTGRAGIFDKIKEIDPTVKKDSPEVEKILKELKSMEYLGYQFEGASAGLEMLILRCLSKFTPSFEMLGYKITDELPYERGCSATGVIKVRVDGKIQISAAEGEGPVNALDKALREALQVFYPELSTVRLIDYKVRVLEPKDATAAFVRVLITSSDGENVWTTVGVSNDVIEASFKGLVDSIEYKLYKKGTKHIEK